MIRKYEFSDSVLAGADGLRALACLGVIAHHLAQRLAMPAQQPNVQEVQAFALLGSTGVSMFFVLSGFLLSFPFWKRYLTLQPYPNLKQYALRRAARIVPGYYAALAASIALVLALDVPMQQFWPRAIAGFTFTSGFHYNTFFPSELNGPLWSIGFEVVSYALMPLFMAGLFFGLGGKRGFAKGLLFWIGVSAAVLLANHLVHRYFTPDEAMRGWEFGMIGGAKFWMPNYNPVGFFAHFAIGIVASGAAARLYADSEAIAAFRRRGGFDLLAVLSLAGAAVLLWELRHSAEFSFSWQNQPYFYPLFPALVGAALTVAPHSRWAGRLLDNPVFRYIARVSFGLYVWHYLLISLAAMYVDKNYQYMGIADIGDWALLSAGIVAASLLIATVSYYAMEKPILNWAHRRTPPTKRMATADPAA